MVFHWFSAPTQLAFQIRLTATLLDRLLYSQSYSLSVTWTLAVEIWFYGMVLLLLPIMKRNQVRATVWLLVLFCIVSAPSLVVPYFRATSIYMVYIPIFVIGRLAFLLHHKRISNEHFCLLFAAATLAFVSVHEARYPGDLFSGPIIKAITYPTAIIAFFAAISMNINTINRPLLFLADISYSMYLLHLPVGVMIITMLYQSIGYTAALFFAVVAIFFMSYLSWMYIEKPFQKAARNIYNFIQKLSLHKIPE